MKCGECKFWKSGNNKENYNRGVRGLGRCSRMPDLWDCTEWKEDPDDKGGWSIQFNEKGENQKAFVQDGSDYSADLYTLTDFGCVLFEPTQEAQKDQTDR